MPTPDQMIAVVHAYVAAFEAESADAIAELFAENATVEDPVGTPIHRGREALRAFYAQGVSSGARLKLEGPIRIAGDYAVFPFVVGLLYEGSPKRIYVIDTFKFDEHGKIVEMRAYWGPTNMHGF